MLTLSPLKPGDLVFDVGANRGDKTARYLSQGARVVCIEPQPACVTALQERFADNSNVTILPNGLSDKNGTLTLSICDEDPTLSTFSHQWKEGRFAGKQWNRTVEVPVITLDNVISQHGLPAYCKIDVEGFELSVLRGLSQAVDLLSFEFTKEFVDNAAACTSLLTGIGMGEFNVIIGENEQFALDAWVDADTLVQAIRTTPAGLLWGDIYARRSHSASATHPTPQSPVLTVEDGLPATQPLLWGPHKQIKTLGDDLLLELAGRPICLDVKTLYIIGVHLFQEQTLIPKLFPNVKTIYLFEAIPQVARHLYQITIPGIELRVFNYAVADTNGYVNFHVTSNNGESSSLLPLAKHRELFPQVTEAATVRVEAHTLDEIIRWHGLTMPDMIFTDVQGAEYRILASISSEVLSHTRLIYTEVSLEELYQGARPLSDVRRLLAPHFAFAGFAPLMPNCPTHGNALFVKPSCAHLLFASTGADVPDVVEFVETVTQLSEASQFARAVEYYDKFRPRFPASPELSRFDGVVALIRKRL